MIMVINNIFKLRNNVDNNGIIIGSNDVNYCRGDESCNYRSRKPCALNDQYLCRQVVNRSEISTERAVIKNIQGVLMTSP